MQLPAHNYCFFSSKPTVTHSSPDASYTELYSAFIVSLSTNKTKIPRTTFRVGCSDSLTDNTGYWPSGAKLVKERNGIVAGCALLE